MYQYDDDATFSEPISRVRDAHRGLIEARKARTPRWRNVFGVEIDLDDIDREYALNIYTMAVQTRTMLGYTRADFMEDRLVTKLRDIILTGRPPNLRDRLRGEIYNLHARLRGLPYRAKGL